MAVSDYRVKSVASSGRKLDQHAKIASGEPELVVTLAPTPKISRKSTTDLSSSVHHSPNREFRTFSRHSGSSGSSARETPESVASEGGRSCDRVVAKCNKDDSRSMSRFVSKFEDLWATV
jgi:hypothetical protein